MKILELEMLSGNITETEKYYKSVLGITPYSADKFSVSYRFGRSRLIFRQADGQKPVYHFAIDVPNNRFNEAYRAIKSKTPLLPVSQGSDIADFTNWNARSFYFLDNNGNIVEIITRYANNDISDAPFTAKSFSCVSEIGLVAYNVPQLANRLKKQFGIPIFHRQPRGDKFTVSGDDEGLFIIAERGRDWYPTDIRAQSFRTRVLFYHEGSINHIIK